MGEVSRRLHRKLTTLAPPGDRTRPPKGWRPPTSTPDIAKLIAETCLIEANEAICMNPHQLEALRTMSHSRMEIYEYQGLEQNYVRLKELVTEREFVCHSTSGYRGQNGELWYVRLFPPLEPELATYHIDFTTPYVPIDATQKDWNDFFAHQGLGDRL